MKWLKFFQRVVNFFCLYFTIAVLFSFFTKAYPLDSRFFTLHIAVGFFISVLNGFTSPRIIQSLESRLKNKQDAGGI